MRAQRVREGESRVEMQVVKWTAEGTGKSIIPHSLSVASVDFYYKG